MKTALQYLYRALTSLKLTAGLLIYLAVLMVTATLIPQAGAHPLPAGVLPAQTTETAASSLVTFLGLHHIFISVWFILPLSLFFLNLLLCTARRIRGELNNKRWNNYGPDLIHAGILLLIISAFISLFGRQESQLVLAEGETNRLPNGYSVTLLDFSEEYYADGSARQWHSRIRLTGPDGSERTEDIRVNHPVSAGYLSLYQISYGQIPEVVLNDSAGNRFVLLRRETIAGGNLSARFIGVEQNGPAADPLVTMELRFGKHASPKRQSFRPGDEILPGLSLKQATSRIVSVIQTGFDPGFFPLIVSFLMLGAGLGITFYQRLHRSEKT